MPKTDAELLVETVEIVQRQRTGLVALASTDGGVTDYSLKNDIFRLLEIADQVAQKR